MTETDFRVLSSSKGNKKGNTNMRERKTSPFSVSFHKLLCYRTQLYRI